MSSVRWPAWLPLRDDLRERTPYGAPQHQVSVRLNTNENPHGPSTALVEQIAADVARIAGTLNRYPDRDALALRTALAAHLNARNALALGAEQIWVANGSNEVIQQLFMACGGPDRTAVGFVPSYSMHALIAHACNTTWEEIPRSSDFAIAIDRKRLEQRRPKLVFVTSPNNPTGTAVSMDTLRGLAEITADLGALLVVDEAYAEFARDPSSTALSLQSAFAHVVVLRTMSKAFALAGARVGYLVADPSVVEALQLVRLPYHLSSVTQAVALAALEHAEQLLASVDQVRAERDRLASRLTALGLEVVPSDANFLLFAVPGRPHEIWQQLLDSGVLIRDVGLDGYLRVTAGTSEENDRFLAAITTLIQSTR